MNKTSIEWTTFTANPLKFRRKSDGKTVWGCVKTSPGCAHCYAESIALRFERGKLFNAKNMEELEPFLDESELKKMLTAKTIGDIPVSCSRCFVGDMTDMFGEWVPYEMLDRLFAVFALRPDVTWQVLTKRAERMDCYFAENDGLTTPLRIEHQAQGMRGKKEGDCWAQGMIPWPLPNVWLGVSAEDQQRADERIPHLLRTPAAVRFVSAEPLLGPVELRRVGKTLRGDDCDVLYGWQTSYHGYKAANDSECSIGVWSRHGAKIDWVIVGGESGPHARPCNVAWIRSLVQQCQESGVSCFVKQVGSKPVHRRQVILEPGQSLEDLIPLHSYATGKAMKDSKGGDPAEWSDDLRVRQFPEASR